MLAGEKQKFLGQGSYGCVMKPGYDCRGNTNKLKNSVTKITEINFASKNELLIGNIIKKFNHNNKKIYKFHFAPVYKYCIIEFNRLAKLDIDKCENLLDNINYPFYDLYSNFIKTKFYMFYIRYIYGAKTITKFLKSYLYVPKNEITINYIYTFHYLLQGILLLQKNNIVHNDLFDRNIIVDNKLGAPIIIDFGLSYYHPKLYSRKNKKIYIKYIHKSFFDFRSDSYQYNIDKRFITFFLHNNNEYFLNKVTKKYQKNELTQELLDIFIDDACESILNSESLKKIFENDEIEIYRKSMSEFYGRFLNKSDYPTYFSILHEMLPIVFEYTDIYSLSVEYIKIYNKLLVAHDKNNILYNLFLQLFKKVLLPLPEYRLNTLQIKNIIEFLIQEINSFDLKNYSDSYSKFIRDFDRLLVSNNIQREQFFFKGYAFIDFEKTLSVDNITIFKGYHIHHKKFIY